MMKNDNNTPIIKDEVAEYFSQNIFKRRGGKTLMELSYFMKELDKREMTKLNERRD
ncbi:hypothetical protein [Bacillus amyloliquefaciens]|uniref:hypothetical protein n=1 Tax=Bacillus amyloliquefaciens TaxID=1390 RepID=UPI0004024F74|nr:hypothetical protein [Bacillus amyloliquefaciens]